MATQGLARNMISKTKKKHPHSSTKTVNSPERLLILGAILVASILVAAYSQRVTWINPHLHEILNFREAAAWGQFGDFMGGILNPVIAFFALLGLVMSVKIQRQTLQSTTDGLEDQLAIQQKQLSKQTFFDLLRLRTESINSLEWEFEKNTYRGRAAIKAIIKMLGKVAQKLPSKDADVQKELKFWNVPIECPEEAKPYVAIFSAFYSRDPVSYSTAWLMADAEDEEQLGHLEGELGHVFRATYQVLKFVYESSDFEDKDKTDLVNYLRAQMSEAEFALFALTAVTSIGEKSRAISIAFDLYQNRLLSIDWAKNLKLLFDPNDKRNADFAEKMEYPLLSKAKPC
jgi:hypothetical protein